MKLILELAQQLLPIIDNSKSPRRTLGLILILSSLYLGWEFFVNSNLNKKTPKFEMNIESQIEAERFRVLMKANSFAVYQLKGDAVKYLEPIYKTPLDISFELSEKNSIDQAHIFNSYSMFNCVSYPNAATDSKGLSYFRSTCPIPIKTETLVVDLYFLNPPKKAQQTPSMINPYDDYLETPLFRFGVKIASEM